LRGLYPALRGLHQHRRVLQDLFRKRSHRRLGDAGRVLGQGGQQRQRRGRQRQHCDAVGAREDQAGMFGFAQRIQRRTAFGSEFGHDPRNGPAGRFKCLQGVVQPGVIAGGDPCRRLGARLGLQREMHRLGLIEQLVFDQALQHAAKARRASIDAFGQLHAVPGQHVRRHDRHHFAACSRGHR